jgi:hypothetical protein
MKKTTLVLSIVAFTLTAAAAPRSGAHEQDHWLGRHGYDKDEPTSSVPEANSTLALAAIGMTFLGIAAASLKRKKI